MFGITERILPQSLEAETAIIGSILRDNMCLGRIKKWIKSSTYFYSAAHRMMFESMEELAEKGAPIELVSLHDWMEKKGQLERIGGAAYLAEIADYGTPANVEYYAKLVWQAAVKRQLVGYASELTDNACDSGTAEAKEIIGRYVEQMQQISEMLAREDGVMNIQESLQDFMKEIEEAQERDGLSGIPYGWDPLDRVTGGMHPGEVITIVARLGVGKSWTEVLFQKRTWEFRKRSLFVSMEMPPESVRRRLVAMVACVSNMDLRLGRLANRQMNKVADACGYLHGTGKDRPMYVVGADLIDNVRDIDAFIDGLRPDMVFVDGVYLLDDDNKRGDLWSATTKVIRKLKKVAARRKIPIVAAAQFNREAVKKGGMGGAEDIGGTDAIGQTSDVVIALAQNEDQERDRVMVVKNLKNREGIKVEFRIRWDLDLMEFKVLDVENEDDEEAIAF